MKSSISDTGEDRADDTHHIFVLGLELAEHPCEGVHLNVQIPHGL
jgi:hypothetical protein